MIVVRTVAELREAVSAARRRGATVGLVPTMGAFHEGHLTLMRRARERCAFVVVTLFVNPAQFSELADLAQYPRDEARDGELAATTGADVLFVPAVEQIYPAGFSTTVDVSGVSEPLEGAARGAKHFRGVATVVTKLLNMVQPDDAFFGQKDAQQALLIRRMTRDLDFPVRIEVCPTVREHDGLAMSSRNVLLDTDARRRAPALARALFAVSDAVARGERSSARVLASGAEILDEAGIAPEYFAAVSTETLAPVARIERETLVALAARFGPVRLIDNVLVSPRGRDT
jgi:pantoate--beta-alanine ligase